MATTLEIIKDLLKQPLMVMTEHMMKDILMMGTARKVGTPKRRRRSNS